MDRSPPLQWWLAWAGARMPVPQARLNRTSGICGKSVSHSYRPEHLGRHRSVETPGIRSGVLPGRFGSKRYSSLTRQPSTSCKTEQES